MSHLSRWVGIALFGLVFVGLGWAVREQVWGRSKLTRPLSVSESDREIAWIHTSTNANTWERFVAGINRANGIEVDDSGAFPEKTTAVPEVVIRKSDHSGKLLIRWYKLTSQVSATDLVDALAERDPPPLAFIGGGSTDRAVDLALALQNRTQWKGQRPLLLITTATANKVFLPDTGEIKDLVRLYQDRSFRFCFTNDQMASAVLDFVFQTPDLRPGPVLDAKTDTVPQVFSLEWEDDPFSGDLSERFRTILHESCMPGPISRRRLPYSVGTFNAPNKWEAEAAGEILREIPTQPGQRSLLILPTVAPPARRVLRTLTGESPLIGQRLVAVNGDGIAFNIFYRDADVAWPIRDIPVPFVFFTHQNPIAWDTPNVEHKFPLHPPNSTDDVLLFADLVDRLSWAMFLENGQLAQTSNQLAERFRKQGTDFFDANGDRLPGSGEHIVVVRPRFSEQGRVDDQASIEIWNRKDGKLWQKAGHLLK